MGVFSAVLARKRAAGVIGIDLSEQGIRRACRLADDLQLPNAGFAQGNILTLPFPDRSFDIVWSWGTVHHTADPHKALRELIRVLKDDGTLFVTLYHRTKLSFVHDATRKAMRLAHPRTWPFLAKLLALALYPVTRLLKRRNKVRAGESLSDLALDWYFNPVRHYYQPEEIRELLEQEGFAIERFLPASGRFNSTSNFIFKARLARKPRFRSAGGNAAAPENRSRRGGCL
jgi:ubiquinone/menaquinone biosynthesis C-methylase UbiE